MGSPDDEFTVSPEFIHDLRAARVQNFFESPAPPIMHCWTTDKVSAAWKELIARNFSSFPVLDVNHKFAGFLKVTDIALWLSNQFAKRKGKEEAALSHDPVEWATLTKVEIFGDLTVQTLMHASSYHEETSMVSLPMGYSMLYALEKMAHQPGLHRLAVLAEDNRLINFLCELSLADFLSRNIASMGAKALKPMNKCLQFYRNVISVKATEGRVIDALRKMATHQISGIAVVGEKGELLNNLSARDIEAVGPSLEYFWRLYQTPRNFLKHEVQMHEGHHPRIPVTLTGEDTIATALQRMVESHVHRLYIVDHDRKPIGVATILDLLQEILS
jgi:CBS domain-containing protein